MLKKFSITLALLLIFFVYAGGASANKISVFNFGTTSLEASGLGTTVTNTLVNELKKDTSISLLDRKDLEAFLNFNDLQQNDQLDNVVDIGTRLGLDFIIVGSVDKKGSAIYVNCSLIQIDKKKEVYSTRARAFGESTLSSEVVKLGSLVSAALKKNSSASAVAGSSGDKAVPVCPPNFQKIPGGKKITLRWQETPGFAGAGYEVYRALNQAGPYGMIGQTDSLEYVDQNVEKDTTYFYKVRALDKVGRTSDYTPVLSACTDLAPNPPVIFKTEGHAKSILVVWGDNPLKSPDSSPLTGYKIYRSKTEDGHYQEIVKLSVQSLSSENSDGKMYYRDKALPDGSVYFYRLAAYNAKDVESELSRPLKGTVLAKVAAVNTQSDLIREVRLNWSGIQSPFIVAYNIYRSLKNEGEFTKIKKIKAEEGTASFAYTDLEGLGDKKNYFYYVTAEDDLGVETSPSPVAKATTRDVPPQVANFTARGGMVKKVELSWTASKLEEVEGYNIYSSPEKEGKYTLLKKISGRESNTYLDESRSYDQLADNKAYYYKLTAYNKVEAESLPVSATATTKPRPQKPAGLKGESLKVKEVPLAWQANPEKDITVYHVFRTAGEKDDFARVDKVDKYSYVDKGLKDGVTYRYKIQAEDKDGLLSDHSEIITVNTKPKPKVTEGLTGVAEPGKTEISWKANTEADISHYIVYEKRFFSLEKITEVKSVSYTDTAVVKGKNKIYVVTAVDRDGLESEPGTELTISAK
ncbi:MAG: Exoglucanase B precursor [Smithella sp. PtaU1.Bin162]|nr:MAG: Exoglucanase B precursor [Smithella sp. PtaU1.Bin162]